MIQESFITSNRLPSETGSSTRQKFRSISSLKILQSTIYVVALLGLIGITARETYQSLHHYLNVPTYTSMAIVRQEEVDFPSMTFCPLWDNYAFKKDVLKVSTP